MVLKQTFDTAQSLHSHLGLTLQNAGSCKVEVRSAAEIPRVTFAEQSGQYVGLDCQVKSYGTCSFKVWGSIKALNLRGFDSGGPTVLSKHQLRLAMSIARYTESRADVCETSTLPFTYAVAM